MFPFSTQQGRRPWSVFVALLPFQFIFGLIYAWSAIAPVIHRQEVGWSNAQLDLAFGLTPLSLLPAVILGGRLVERHSGKPLLALANVCFCLGGFMGLTAHGALPFLLGYSVLALGVGAGLSTPACIAMVARVYPAHRGKLGGALLAIYGLSAMVTAPLFHWLLAYGGWRQALGIITSAYALLGWLAWACLPDAKPEGLAPVRHRKFPWNPDTLRAARPLLANVALLLAATPFGAASFAGLGRLLPPVGFSGTGLLLLVSAMALANGAGRFLGGILADAWPEKSGKLLIYTVNALAFLNLLLAQGLHWPLAMVLYPGLAGLAYGALAGNLPAIARLISPAHPHTVFGLLFGTFALGSFLGPLCSALGGLSLTLYGFGALSCGAALAAFWEWRTPDTRSS